MKLKNAQCPYCYEGEVELHEKAAVFACNRCMKNVGIRMAGEA